MPFDSTLHNKGRNWTPRSSVLKFRTRPYDCSALTPAPEMGEFLNCPGDSGSAATRTVGPGLKQLWAERGRSDGQSLGLRAEPFIDHGTDYVGETRMWHDPAAGDVGTAITALAAGAMLSVAARADGLMGPCPLASLGAGTHFIIGYVKTPPADAVSPMSMHVYEHPQRVVVPAP
jgi:hypothetical protein